MDNQIIEYAHEQGYTVAGFMSDIYEDARIMITPVHVFSFDPLTPEKIKEGRVLSIYMVDSNSVNLVLEFPDGMQAPLTYARGYPVFFKLPENVDD
jgi:hypothetical protein